MNAHQQNSSYVIFSTTENVRDLLVGEVSSSEVAATVLDLLNDLMPTIQANATESSSVGSYQRALTALHQVHTNAKVCEFNILIFYSP